MSAPLNGPQDALNELEPLDETGSPPLRSSTAPDAPYRGTTSARLALQASQLGTWEWHAVTQRVLWSPEVETIYGLAPGTFGGTYEDFFRFVHPDDRQRLNESILRALTDRAPYQIEHRLIRPDGSERWILCRGNVVTDPVGTVTGMAGTVADITDLNQMETVNATLRIELEQRVAERTAGLEQAVAELKREVERRRQAEEERAASERRYQTLYDDNPSMYFTLSQEGTVLSVNRFGAEQLGYRVEALIGQSILNVFRPEDHQTVLGQLSLCASNPSKLFQWDIQKIRLDGARLWVRERARAIHDQSGRVLILVVCEDTTARRDSEARWRALFEHAGVGIAQVGLDGEFLRVNARLCQTLGYSSKTLLQQTFQAFTHPDDTEQNLLLLNEVAAGTRPSFTMEQRCLRSDGIWLWANLTVSLVRSASGAPAYFIAVVEDISERKQAEEALRMSEVQWHRFVADAPVGMVIVDERQCLLRANKAFCALTGYDEQEVIGNSIAFYTHPDDLAPNLELMDEFFQGKRSGYSHEKRYIRKSGEIIWVSIRTTRMTLPGHAEPLLLAVIENITERKQATEERDQLSQDLHDDILQSLYAIGMGLEITQQRVKQRSGAAAKRLEGSVAQLNNVIRDVRNFIPRIQSPVTPAATFDHAVLALVESLTANGVGKIALDINAAIAKTLTPAQCTHLLSIAREALSNSLRHARATHRALTLRRSRGHIRLTISDDGIGFRPAAHPSNGMGLRNMQARARKMGATLSIASSRGKGTQVRLFLPLAPRQSRSKGSGTRRRPRRQGRRPA